MEVTRVQINDGLSVDIGALTTKEAMQADGIIGDLLGDRPSAGGLALLTTKVYSLCAVRKLYFNGEDGQEKSVIATPLAGAQAFDSIVARFSLIDLTKLMTEYDHYYGVKSEELKNESSADQLAT